MKDSRINLLLHRAKQAMERDGILVLTPYDGLWKHRLYGFAASTDRFTFHSVVVVKKSVEPQERLITLLHEWAHVELGHVRGPDRQSGQEHALHDWEAHIVAVSLARVLGCAFDEECVARYIAAQRERMNRKPNSAKIVQCFEKFYNALTEKSHVSQPIIPVYAAQQ